MQLTNYQLGYSTSVMSYIVFIVVESVSISLYVIFRRPNVYS
jgi:hypothetical protein